MSIYCSKGHESPDGSRFCLECGEKLEDSVTSNNQSNTIPPGKVLSASPIGNNTRLRDRYSILRQIGQGGFGRTYLAEDINRFNELCVLKEFSPQVQTDYVLQKAEELFQREASVLYKLKHPQIPNFRELFRTNIDDNEYLFLVQDYIEGQTYKSLLDARLQQGIQFSEAEVRKLLKQILPVISYIHSIGVIHRDISPDNLILRTVDQLPVLIDFGGVKQVAAKVASTYYDPGANISTPSPTLLGKIGYAPPEQMQTGSVETHSDLYALAATMLVLLSGKQPSELIDTYNLTWNWRQTTTISPALGQIFDKMLAAVPGSRYQTADEVIEALNQADAGTVPTQPHIPTPVYSPQPQNPTQATIPVSPGYGRPQVQNANVTNQTGNQTGNQSTSENQRQYIPSAGISKSWWTPGKIILIFLVVAAATGVGVWGATNLIGNSGRELTEEQDNKAQLKQLRERLGIDYNFYVKLVNQVFWDRNPRFRGRSISDAPEDAELRSKWNAIAQELLNKMSVLSANARKKLGSYSRSDRDRWKNQVNQVNVGSRALFDLGDAAFFNNFPEQRGREFINEPIGQVWYGFTSDKVSAILARSAYERIRFSAGTTSETVRGNLNPGDGRVFIAELGRGQKMSLNLEADSRILLSVYSPTGKFRFLEDSSRRRLSVELPESGYYEFVVVSTASQRQDYQLGINVETQTPEPTPDPTPEPTPDPTPEPTPDPTPTTTTDSTPDPTSTPVN